MILLYLLFKFNVLHNIFKPRQKNIIINQAIWLHTKNKEKKLEENKQKASHPQNKTNLLS